MATRSTISIIENKKTKEGRTIYCHWDGYPAHNGALLLQHYTTEKSVKELVGLGSLSILGEKVGEKVDFNNFDSGTQKQCLAYGRDRGETNVEPKTFVGKPKQSEDYNYLFDNGVWFVSKGDNNRFVRLTKKMAEI